MVESLETVVAIVNCFRIEIIATDRVSRVRQFDEQAAGSTCGLKDPADFASTVLRKTVFEEIDFCFPVRPKQQIVVTWVVVDAGFDFFFEFRHVCAFELRRDTCVVLMN